MKKQTKSKKQKAAQPVTTVRVVHNGWQRFWGAVALTGLFLCGFFVGMAISSPKINNTQTEQTTEDVVDVPDVCIQVERLLVKHLPVADDNVDNRIERAKVYVSLAERGCIENTDKYAELARQELEVARAIDDDNFNHAETIDVIETYKRLNMQAAAEEIFEKAKKLTDPTIDFIIQIQKIINE